MRMRRKPNLIPRMEKCAEFLISEPEKMPGKWKETGKGYELLNLELGCGKGKFTAELAAAEPDSLTVAVEKVPDAMVVAMERAKNGSLENTRFISGDVSNLKTMFADGEVDVLYINFCDPWPKSRDAKLRLTAPGFLRIYADILTEGGEIRFKTDNTPLFDWSAERFSEEGWELIELTHDLHAAGPVGIMTDYESKFYAQGMKINKLVARKTESTKGTAAGQLSRLRNASLVDARGYEESAKAAEGEKN